MKQAQNQTQTIQVLYELALAIGSSLDLDQMLTTSMQAFADKLDCAVSTVYRCQTSKTACQFDAVGTNSPQADKMETVQLALAHLPTTSDEQAVAQFMATLPLVAQGAADDFYHLLGLPGFGVLLLVKDKAPLDEGLMVGIRPLQEKLAIAANACLSQEQTHNSQGQSQTILESITTPLLISRISDGLILYANDLLADMIGTTAAQLIGNVTPDFYANTADRTTLLTKLQAQGLLTNYELQIKKSSGELIWVLLSIKPFNYQGDPALIATFLDITERKQVLQQLRDSRERARAILESVTLPLIISRLDDGTVLYANERVLEMMGMEAEEIIGNQTPNFYQNPADRTKVIQEAEAHGGVDNMELPIWRKGESRWALISNRLTQYDDQQAIITTLIDITDRKLAEEAQAKRAAELETVARVSASTASILETDKLLQDVVDLTKERFGLYHAHVYLLNKAGDKLMLTAGAGEIGQQMVVEKRSIPLNQEQSLVAQAARTRKGVIENDVLKNPAFLPHPLLPDTRAEMAVPMLIGDKVIGVLDTQADQVGWFTQQDILIKTTLAAQVAVALENARSFESARTSLAETEALLDITKESSRTLELQAILESVLDRVMAATKFEAGLISLENPDTHVLELYNHRLPAKFLQVLQKNGLDNTLCDLVYRRQESIVVDLNGDAPVDVSGLVKLGYNAYQGVPIAAKGDVFGTICLFSTHRLDSDEANTVFLQAVGQQVGIAIQNANLLKQTQVALTEVEQSREVVQEYLDMQRVLHEMNAELLQVDDLDELYRRAIELAHTRLGFERIGMYLLNEAKDTLLGTYGVDVAGNIRSEQGPEHVITDPATINTFVLNRTRLSVAEDIDLLQENEVVGHGWHMGAAMWAEEAAIGVIFADNLLTGQPLKPYQSELLFAYAGAVANLILRRRVEKTIRERETLLRTIIDSTPDWIFVKDQNHRYLLVNQGYADSMQMAPEEFIGKNDLDIGFPEDIVKGNAEKGIRGFWADDLEIMESGQMKVIDIEPAVIEGEQRYLNTIKAPLKDANGTVTAVIGFVHDITDRVQIEETIRERETLLRTIIDSTPDWIFVKDEEHRYRLVNQGYADSMHMAPEEFIGKNDLDIGFPEEIVKGNPEKGIRGFWADDKEIMARGERKIIDEEPAVVDGEARVLHTVKVPLHGANDAVTGLVGFVQDITNRKQIEVTLHQSEEKFRSLFEQSVDAYLILEGNLFVDCNQATVDMLRASSKEEVLTLHPSQFSPERQPDGRLSGEKADEMIQTAVEQGNHRFEWIHRRLDGEDFFAEVLLTPILMGGKQAVFAVIRDVTDRKQAEEALRRNEAELSQALEIAKLSYWEYDVEKDLFTFNDQFYALFHTTAEQHGGYQLSSAYYAEHFVHPDDLSMVGGEIEQALNSADMHYSRSLEHRILYADGGVGYISVNINIDRDEQGNILRYYGANQDITERKRIESAIAKQAQELQIVAELSTTVATTLEQEKLLQEVVDLTKERFEFYHAQIYLLNAQQNRLALAFGAGDVGRTLVAQQHQIALNAPQSLVAQAARSGQAVVVNDVRENLDWLPNKLLPETQAEMAVPMMVGDRVVGVLDVQSASVNRFTDQDVQIQTTLAAQVSIALENARSFEQAQTAVAEMNALTRRLTHEGWDDYFDNVRDEKLSFSFDGSSVQDVQDTAVNATLQDELIELLERPIEVRGVKIGKMALMPEEEDPELEEVVNSVMQQLASHIENLRLTEQVQISLAQTEALYTGSERIVLSSTEADILESLIYSTQLRNLERANIFLFDQPVEDNVARDVTVVAVWENEGVPHTVDVGARFTVDQVPFLSMVTSEAAMVVADIREDPRIDEATRQILQGYGMTSFVLFPMVVGSQWLGMVSGQSARPLYINDVQRRQTSSLVSQASVVLQTTILFRQEQARARREQMLRAIATKVRSSTDVDSIMRTAVTEIGRTLGRRAFIKLSDGQLMETAEENGVAL